MYTDESDLANTESQPPSQSTWVGDVLPDKDYDITKEVSVPPA